MPVKRLIVCTGKKHPHIKDQHIPQKDFHLHIKALPQRKYRSGNDKPVQKRLAEKALHILQAGFQLIRIDFDVKRIWQKIMKNKAACPRTIRPATAACRPDRKELILCRACIHTQRRQVPSSRNKPSGRVHASTTAATGQYFSNDRSMTDKHEHLKHQAVERCFKAHLIFKNE